MNPGRWAILFFSTALLSPGNVYPQWARKPSPEILVPLATNAILVRGDTILLGTYQNTIFRSTDGGASWGRADSGLSPSLYWTFSFLLDGGTLYAGTYDGVYRSTNMGATWALANNGLLFGVTRSVYSFLKMGDSLFAGTEVGVYHTTNGGTSWWPDTAGLPLAWHGPIHCLASRQTTMFAGTDDGIYRSTNGGGRWQAVNAGIPIWWSIYHAGVEAILVDSNRIHIVTNGWGAFRSINDGDTWAPETTGFNKQFNGFFHAMTSILQKDGRLFVGTQEDGVYESTDDGGSWRNISAGLPTSSYVLSLAAKDGALFAAAFEGLYRKNGDSSAWSSVLTSVPGKVDFRSMGAGASNLFVEAYSNYDRGEADAIFLSSDGGGSWVSDTNLARRYVWFQTIRGALYSLGNGLSVSSDDGLHWSEIDSGLYRPVNGIAENDTTLFAATGSDWWQWGESGGVYVSKNHGVTWSSLGLKDTLVWAIAVNGPALFPTLFAGGLRGVYRSTDEGTSWVMVNEGLPTQQTVSQLVILPPRLCLQPCPEPGIVFAGTCKGVFKSTDNGESWTPANTGLPLDSLGFISPLRLLVYGGDLIAGTATGIYVTSDAGLSWAPASSGLTGNALQIGSLAVLGNDLYATTADGIWHRPLSEILSVRESPAPSLPRYFTLDQNFPNPFNPATSITYGVPQRAHVGLQIFNTLGQLVQTLVDEDTPAGAYTVKWDAGSRASGLYFYRMSAGGFLATKKALLMR